MSLENGLNKVGEKEPTGQQKGTGDLSKFDKIGSSREIRIKASDLKKSPELAAKVAFGAYNEGKTGEVVLDWEPEITPEGDYLFKEPTIHQPEKIINDNLYTIKETSIPAEEKNIGFVKGSGQPQATIGDKEVAVADREARKDGIKGVLKRFVSPPQDRHGIITPKEKLARAVAIVGGLATFGNQAFAANQNNMEQRSGEADTLSYQQMDQKDTLVEKGLKAQDEDRMDIKTINVNGKNSFDTASAIAYIKYIEARGQETGHGVHMSTWKNSLGVLSFFNGAIAKAKKEGNTQMLQTIQSEYQKVMYHPGSNSKWRDLTLKMAGTHVEKVNGIDVAIRQGAKVEVTKKPHLILAYVKGGYSYVILPPGTPIVKFQDKAGNTIEELGACNNHIVAWFNEACPPCPTCVPQVRK